MMKNNKRKCTRSKIRNSRTSLKMIIKDHAFFGMNSEDNISVSSVMKKLRGCRYE